MKLHRLKPHPNSIALRVLGQLLLSGKERQLRLLLGPFIEGFDHPAPPLLLAVVDLAQIQHLALHHLAPGAALTLDDVPIAMLFTVLPSPIAAQLHLGIRW